MFCNISPLCYSVSLSNIGLSRKLSPITNTPANLTGEKKVDNMATCLVGLFSRMESQAGSLKTVEARDNAGSISDRRLQLHA